MRRAGVPTGRQLHGPVPGSARHFKTAITTPGSHLHAPSLKVPAVPSTVCGIALRVH